MGACIKEKAVVYPFDREFSPIVRHKNLISSYDIIAAVSPNGWGFTGEDAGNLDAGSSVGITVTYNFEKMLDICDTLIISESALKLNFEKIIFPKISMAAQKEKKLVCLAKFDNELLEKIYSLYSKKGLDCKFYNLIEKEPYRNLRSVEIKKIKTPVIYVLGMTVNTNKFELQLSIREKLLNIGYKVSQVGTRNYCELLGFHSFPKFMYSKSFSETEKVKLFNNYIKDIEDMEKPDVIVIGVPGGTMRVNDVFTYDFGILAYELSQAVKPDGAILSVLYEDYLPEIFEEFTKEIRYKFGFEIDCFNLVNVKLDWNSLKQEKSLKYTYLGLEVIQEKLSALKNSCSPVFNIISDKDDVTNYLIERLACDEYEVV